VTYETFLVGLKVLEQNNARQLMRRSYRNWWQQMALWDGTFYLAACRAYAARKPGWFPSLQDLFEEYMQLKRHEATPI